jgi:hypothetical protein
MFSTARMHFCTLQGGRALELHQAGVWRGAWCCGATQGLRCAWGFVRSGFAQIGRGGGRRVAGCAYQHTQYIDATKRIEQRNPHAVPHPVARNVALI